MANIAPFGIYRAFDQDGYPLVGGKLYTYIAGTTTLQSTYTTAAGDVPNTNPVILDGNGEANVWLGDGGYKFVLKDANDVTQWTTDNIGGMNNAAFGGIVNTITTNTTITPVYANSINDTSGNITLSLLPSTSAGEGFYFSVNVLSGTTTIDPDGTETINGQSSISMSAGTTGLIYCTGTEWYTLFYYATGTSGHVLGYLDGDNTYSGKSTHTNQVNFFKGSDIPSATSIDLGAATGNTVTVTGTTTITALGTIQAGTCRNVIFSGSLILTHNATSLILPNNGANITTIAGDAAEFVSLGSGNWKCINYQRIDGTAVAVSPPQSSIAGFLPSSIAGTNTTATLTVSAGQAADTTSVTYISKGTTTAWAVTNGNAINGYQGGTTLPNSSTIHFFICSGASGTGTFASTSLTPTLPTGYATYYRRIFSLLTTGAGAFISLTPATEIAGGSATFYLTTQVQDVAVTNLGTTVTAYTLSVPTGVKMQPLLRANVYSGGSFILLSGDETAVTPPLAATTTVPQYDSAGSGTYAGNHATSQLLTNTSGQVRAVGSSASTPLYITTRGWVDNRR